MDEKEFLEIKPSNCKGCGNKVRAEIKTINDGQSTLRVPSINCYYCKPQKGAFWPNEFSECLADWESI
jgi:hypothetical protein